MSHAEAECYRRWYKFLAVDLMLLVHQFEQLRTRAEQAFRIPDHQEASGIERVMKHGDHALLQGWSHINENVAATDKVHPGKGRVIKDILGGENAHVPDRL